MKIRKVFELPGSEHYKFTPEEIDNIMDLFIMDIIESGFPMLNIKLPNGISSYDPNFSRFSDNMIMEEKLGYYGYRTVQGSRVIELFIIKPKEYRANLSSSINDFINRLDRWNFVGILKSFYNGTAMGEDGNDFRVSGVVISICKKDLAKPILA